MDPYWRLAGNPGFNASIDHIRDRLVTAGFSLTAANAPAGVRVDEFPNSGRGWDYRIGTLEFDDGSEPLLSRDRDRVSLAINSFSTPAGGLLLRSSTLAPGRPAIMRERTSRERSCSAMRLSAGSGRKR